MQDQEVLMKYKQAKFLGACYGRLNLIQSHPIPHEMTPVLIIFMVFAASSKLPDYWRKTLSAASPCVVYLLNASSRWDLSSRIISSFDEKILVAQRPRFEYK